MGICVLGAGEHSAVFAGLLFWSLVGLRAIVDPGLGAGVTQRNHVKTGLEN